jgi:hypothetical protein
MRSVILVEGISDRVALETLAHRLGLDLHRGGVAILPIGGAQAVARVLGDLRNDAGVIGVVGLCDAGEEAGFRRAFDRAGMRGAVYVCHADLEDELIRALGAARVEEVVEGHGDLGPFRTLQKQPAWQGRPLAEQLQRFMGSGGRRKTRYARFLVEAIELDRVPRPLEDVLAHAVVTRARAKR